MRNEEEEKTVGRASPFAPDLVAGGRSPELDPAPPHAARRTPHAARRTPHAARRTVIPNRFPWAVWCGLWLLGLTSCTELDLSNPYDPETSAENRARGELAVRVELAPGDWIRAGEARFADSPAVQVRVEQTSAPDGNNLGSEQSVSLAALDRGPVELLFRGLPTGPPTAPRYYQIQLRDHRLFTLTAANREELASRPLEQGTRRTAVLQLQRQRTDFTGQLSFGARNPVDAWVTLIDRAVLGEGPGVPVNCANTTALLQQVPLRGPAATAGEALDGGVGADGSAPDGDRLDRWPQWVSRQTGFFQFRAVPAIHPGYCLLVEADGYRPIGVDAASLREPVRLVPLDLPFRLWNPDTLAACTRTPDADCPLWQRDAAGDSYTRHRLILVEVRRELAQLGETELPRGLSVSDHDRGVPAPVFCYGPADSDRSSACSWGGGQPGPGSDATWRLLTHQAVADADTFCPPAPGQTWQQVWPELGTVAAPADPEAPEVGDGAPAAEPGGPLAALQTLVEQGATGSPEADFYLYCLEDAGDGRREVRLQTFTGRGIASQPFDAWLTLDQARPALTEFRLARWQGEVGVEGNWIGDTLYLRYPRALMLVTATDELAGPDQLQLTWTLQPVAAPRGSDRSVADLARCVPGFPQRLPNLGEVPLDLLVPNGLLCDPVTCPPCEGQYLLRLAARDPAGNVAERKVPVVFDVTPPDITPGLIPANPQACQLLNCPDCRQIDPGCTDADYISPETNPRVRWLGDESNEARILTLPERTEDLRFGAHQYGWSWDNEALPPALELYYPTPPPGRDHSEQRLDLRGLLPGAHVLYFWVNDRAGNLRALRVDRVILDDRAPRPSAFWLRDNQLVDRLELGPAWQQTPAEQPTAQLLLMELNFEEEAPADYQCVRVRTVTEQGDVRAEEIRRVGRDGLVTYLGPERNADIEEQWTVELLVIDPACNPGTAAQFPQLRCDTRPPRATVELLTSVAVVQDRLIGPENRRVYLASLDLWQGLSLSLGNPPPAEEELTFLVRLEWVENADLRYPPSNLGPRTVDPCQPCRQGEFCGVYPFGDQATRGCWLALTGALATERPLEQRGLLRVKLFDRAGNRSSQPVLRVNGVPVAEVALDLQAPAPVDQLSWKVKEGDPTRGTLTWQGGADCSLRGFVVEAWNPTGWHDPDTCDFTGPDHNDEKTTPEVPCTLPENPTPTICDGEPAGGCSRSLELAKYTCYRVQALDRAGNRSAFSQPYRP